MGFFEPVRDGINLEACVAFFGERSLRGVSCEGSEQIDGGNGPLQSRHFGYMQDA